MNKIARFSIERTSEYRNKFSFVNRNIRIKDDDGYDSDFYPCIVLMDVENNIPVAYTGYERFIQSLAASEVNEGTTLSKKAFEVCKFLNYMLHETNINKINDCTLNDIREFMKAYKHKNDKEDYKEDTWNRMVNIVFTFLRNFFISYQDTYEFKYNGNDLQTLTIVKDVEHRKSVKLVNNAKLNVKAPVSTHKKNRVLVYGYLDLLLCEAKKYDPMLTLGIALQSYAGLREGEVTNLTCDRVNIIQGAFSAFSSIELDLTSKAPFWIGFEKKTKPASFKKNQYRIQKVYDPFLKIVRTMYEEHILILEAKGYDTGKDKPLFVNKQGNPMTVQVYTQRVKGLFYDHFLPALKQLCIEQGTWVENAAYIEIYEKEYPGAHMFRHWFTMYLLTKTNLEHGEIMKWRNDHSVDSIVSYIHENSDLMNIYEKSAYRFQEQLLEDIEKKYGKI